MKNAVPVISRETQNRFSRTHWFGLMLLLLSGALAARPERVPEYGLKKRIILCVGINESAGDLTPRRFAESDAKDFCAEWGKHETEKFTNTRPVLLMGRQATRKAILGAAVTQGDTALILYFSGTTLMDHGEPGILPYQGNLGQTDRKKISARDLASVACGAAHITLIFDTENTPLYFRDFAYSCKPVTVEALGATRMGDWVAEREGSAMRRPDSGGVFTRGFLDVLRARKPQDRLFLPELYEDVSRSATERSSWGTDRGQFPSLFFAEEADSKMANDLQ